MRKIIIVLILLPYFLTAQVKKATGLSNKKRTKPATSQKSRFIGTKANSNQLATDQFEYDAVGNVTKDLTQGISNIIYFGISKMELDPNINQYLPSNYYVPHEITFVDGRKIVNNYLADGTKISTKLLKNGITKVVYDYIDNLTFMKIGNGESKLIELSFEGGRAIPDPNDPNKFNYEYDIEDHTGTPRVTFRENPTTHQAEIVRSQDFDPFGQILEGTKYEHPSVDTLQRKYFFNGKEYLITMGLKMYDYGKRQYNPRLGRYYQIDPKASLMPSWSPYAFSFNNPLRFRDYDGQIPYPITVRSFATTPTFGGGFHGDNRGFSTSTGVTARITQNIAYDTDRNYLKTSTWSDISSHPLLGEARATPSGGINSYSKTILGSGVDRSDFSTSYAGANPLTPEGSPNINLESAFSVTANSKKNTLSVIGNLSGDNFPSTEAFINDPSGKAVFLGTGNAQGNPYTSLPGENNNRPISNFNLTIQLDKKGNFSSVNYGGKSFSLTDWNKKFGQ